VSAHHRFVGSAKLIAVLTLASRVLGVVREHAYSQFFGASPLLSAFRVAFQIPNLARRLFGEGALTASFIPVFARFREDDGEESARRLAGGAFTLLTAILLGLLAVGEAGLLAVMIWQRGPALSLTALLLPYMVLICLTAFFAGILNAEHRFAAPAVAPMLLNIVMIAAVWIGGSILELETYMHLQFVAWSVLFAGVLQLALQLGWLRACRFRLRLTFDWRSSGVRQVMTLMAPMMLGMSALQINTFLDSMIAYFLVPDGKGTAILGYSQYMSNLPLGIFGTAVATAIFPLLARHMARKDHDGFLRSVEAGLRTSLYISLPAGVGLMLLAVPLVRFLFESDQFTPSDTRRVVLALVLYCTGIWAYAVQQMLVRAFHSMQNSRTPVRIACMMVVLNFTLNIVLVQTRLQEAGVALATAITASIQAVMLAIAFNRSLPGLRWRSVMWSTMRCLLAVVLMAAAVSVLRGWSPIGAVLPASDLLHLAACTAAGLAVYYLATRLLGLEEGAIILGKRKP
jgi:putative peptidoglycan lipid II flippase